MRPYCGLFQLPKQFLATLDTQLRNGFLWLAIFANDKDFHLKFKIRVETKLKKRSKGRLSNSLNDHKDPPNCVLVLDLES